VVLTVAEQAEVCSVALGRPAFQSSVHTLEGVDLVPSLANNGIRTLTEYAMSEAETMSWWAVDLGHPLAVGKVRLSRGVNHGQLIHP